MNKAGARLVLELGAFEEVSAVIANGASKSSVIDVRGYNSMILMLPAAWTTADIGLLGSNSSADTTPQDLQDSAGNRLKVVVAADESIAMPASIERALAGAAYIFLESIDTSSEAAVNQAAERTIAVLLGR